MTIEYGTAYTLPTPKNTDETKTFISWVNVGTGTEIPLKGVWNYENSLTLVATWEEESEEDWTDNY